MCQVILVVLFVLDRQDMAMRPLTTSKSNQAASGINAGKRGLTAAVLRRAGSLSQWAELVKIEHTVFALPFAMSGLFLSTAGLPSWPVIFWTAAAFTGARAAAMAANRLIDWPIDARNPRTSSRAIPGGRLSPRQAFAFAAGSFALMIASASRLPPVCLYLCPLAIAWLIFYSYTKRFTYFCHLVLGIALGGAAAGGWAAAGGNLATAPPWILSLAVTCWVTGFDIIYACQDIEFDCREHLFSLPACFGIARALAVSTCLHVLTVVTLVWLGFVLGLGIVYWGGVVLAAAMLVREHSMVKADDLSCLNAAFFNMNGYVSIAIFLSILFDKFF